MKITLKTTNHISTIIQFITLINKTDNMTALLLPEVVDNEFFTIEVEEIN